MLRRFLDWHLSFFEKGKRLHKMRPAVSALDTFLYEAPARTRGGPHIRDAVDLKRWMVLVVVSLIPAIIMAIWNTGVQKYVYASSDFRIMNAYLTASESFSGYFEFCFSDGRWTTILGYGLAAFLPVMLISYVVGGICEVLFAIIRGHEVAEGFLVTGILYPLVLPPTIPYWMVAVGVIFGVIVGKELFGGTGMNILNPALTARLFLFFTFPGKMTGNVWVGTNPIVVEQSLKQMNEQAQTAAYDGYTQATPLGLFNIGDDIRRVHVDAIASNNVGIANVGTRGIIEQQFGQWSSVAAPEAQLGSLSGEQLQEFVTAPLADGGLGLAADSYPTAYQFTGLRYGLGNENGWNLFFGNRLGSMGETSTLFCLLGMLFLLYMGIASWRTMLAMGLGAYITALVFQGSAEYFGVDGGAWNYARFAFPAWKQLILGGYMFGLVFMATEPVSSPTMSKAKWFYGGMIGALTILIRYINPAFPEGVMLAILFGNVFSPVFDYYAVRGYRRMRRVAASSS